MKKYTKSLHGVGFVADFFGKKMYGVISVHKNSVYLCQGDVKMSQDSEVESFGYPYTMYLDRIGADMQLDFPFDLLPPAAEYQKLFELILENRKSTWDQDASYSVLPKNVVDELHKMLLGIKTVK